MYTTGTLKRAKIYLSVIIAFREWALLEQTTLVVPN